MTMVKPNGYWTEDRVLNEGQKYASRKEFERGSKGAYKAAWKRGLLDHLYASSQAHFADWSSDESVIAEGRKYASRREFWRGNGSAYNAARKRGLLDHLYASSQAHFADWSDDATVLAEGRRYASRTEFERGRKGAYLAAWKRNLLDLIPFPENNATSDNDTIYIWRAVGQFHGNLPIFKIGVTSQRLGDIRIKDVARAAGFTAAIVAAVPTWMPARVVEAHLHELGLDPGWRDFDGATEFRALDAAALERVLHLMNGYACPGVSLVNFDREYWC